MFKKLKFWFDVIKSTVNAYEEAVQTHGINPLERINDKRRQTTSNATKTK